MLARWCPSLQPPSWRPPKDAACATSWRSRNSPAAAAAARVTRARVCKAAWRFAPAFERNCTRSTSTACTSSSWCRRRGAAGGRGGALGGRRRLVERAPRLGRRRRGRERRVDALLCWRWRGQRAVPHVVDRDGVHARRLVPAGGRGVQNRSRNIGAPDFRALSKFITCPNLRPRAEILSACVPVASVSVGYNRVAQ